MLIDIALMPDIIVHNLARQVSMELDRHFDLGLLSCRFPPHITLKQVFSYQGELDQLQQTFDAFCRISAPTIIRYSGIESVQGQNGTTVIWLDIVPDRSLINMHELLVTMLNDHCGIEPGRLDGGDWRFHITLAQNQIDPALLPQIIKMASRYTNQINAPATRAVMMITPPHRKEDLDASITYRIQKLSGPL